MEPLPVDDAFRGYGEVEKVENSAEDNPAAVETISEQLDVGEAAEGFGRTDPLGSNRDE